MVSVVTPGKYSVWFKTPIGEGAGMAEFFADDTFEGIDSSFAYTGTWNLIAGRLHAKLTAWRNDARAGQSVDRRRRRSDGHRICQRRRFRDVYRLRQAVTGVADGHHADAGA